MKESSSKRRKPLPGRRLNRDDWINAARRALINSGVEGVKVDTLAKRLKVTRGSFYWHFKNRADLLKALLENWETTNTAPMLEAIRASGARGEKEDFETYFGRLLVEERDYSPTYDSAVRDWARTERKVSNAVRRIDHIRIEALAEMFAAYGFDRYEAVIRARITYYHQVGYYALQIKESIEERDRWGDLYNKVLLY
jgi:AcrR family transcriptional regulator